MTPEQFEQILRRVVEGGISLNTAAYLWMLIAMLAGSVIGAFVGAYVKRKGENYATKEDFDVLLEQVKQTTSETEKIKDAVLRTSRIEHDRWKFKCDFYIKMVNTLSRLGRVCRTLTSSYALLEKSELSELRSKRMEKAQTTMVVLIPNLANLISESHLFIGREVISHMQILQDQLLTAAALDVKNITESIAVLQKIEKSVEITRMSIVNTARKDLFDDKTVEFGVKK